MTKLVSIGVSFIVIVAVLFAAYEAYLKKPAPGALSEPIVIAKGMTTSEIADILKRSGVISSTAVFTAVADLSGHLKDLHAGTFIFKEGMSAVDAIKTLSVQGQPEISVTIPEGYDLRDIADRLVLSKVIASSADLFKVTGAPAASAKIDPSLVNDYSFLAYKPANAGLEGYLFPDTYRFYAGTDANTVVRRMLDDYGAKVASLSPAPDYSTLVLASLVEREVRDPADRAKVADIIKRRLALGMPLQFDSTVNYATGKNSPSVSLKDMSIDSLWNTYKYAGLPPTPICNPGLDSIAAAQTPTPNKYLYFLTAPDGTVIYSQTLDEQNAAKAKYLK
jgi:UPF0755 protein